MNYQRENGYLLHKTYNEMVATQVNELGNTQAHVDELLAKINEDSTRIHELYIVSSPAFQTEVAAARKRLGLKLTKHVEVGKRDETLTYEAFIPDTKSVKHDIKVLESCVTAIMKKLSLTENWRDYLSAYIIGGKTSGNELTLFKNDVAVVEAQDADSITIKFKKGLRYDEYIKLWEAVSANLGKGRRKNKLSTKSIRDLQMYHSFYFRGLSQKQIAELYLDKGAEYDIDTVKKAIKRQKKLFDKGIDLAQ